MGVRRPLSLTVAGQEVLTGWPIAISPGWRDYVHSQTQAWTGPIFFHARLGPFFGTETAEPEWAPVGGGHVTNEAGKADLTQFNPKFWDKVRGWAKDVCLAGDYVEFDLIDRWWAKQQVIPNPMRPEWNIQGYDMAAHVGRQAIQPGSPEDLWLAQVVRVLGSLPCVIWEDGNEVGLGGYNPAWTFSMLERVRHHEKTLVNNVAHIFSTNSGKGDAESGPVNYIERHQSVSIPAPLYNKPSWVNEYNPRPAFTPQQMRDRYCLSRQAGTGWWYWRHTQSMEEMSETLRFFAANCPVPPPPNCGLGTPTATEAAARGLRPTFKVRLYGRGLTTTPFACFGGEYCANAGWTDGRTCCAVAPDGHPQKRACEIQFAGAQCPRWYGDCTGIGPPECPITFDTLIGNDPHPMNANAQCPNPYPNHQERPEVFWGRPEGKGWVFACNHDFTVCGRYNQIVDQDIEPEEGT
jgi:hypothetical protein